jgi:hypothetical protein
MEWLIEAVRTNPVQFLSMLISAVSLGVAAGSLLASRQSMKTAKQSLETAQKALGATHLPNVGLELRFEPHKENGEKHLQFFFRNMSAVAAYDLETKTTFSHEEGGWSTVGKTEQKVEPNDSWSRCVHLRFVEACLKLAPNVFEAGRGDGDIRLRLGVPAPQMGVDIELNWRSPAYGMGPVGLRQSWELKPTSFSDDRYCRDWSCRRTVERRLSPAA